MSKTPKIIRILNLKLPESDEDFGKWLERNHARVEIACSFGLYSVEITLYDLQEYTEDNRVSLRRGSKIELSSTSKSFDDAFAKAVTAAEKAIASKKAAKTS
jgi:hypothetical protein